MDRMQGDSERLRHRSDRRIKSRTDLMHQALRQDQRLGETAIADLADIAELFAEMRRPTLALDACAAPETRIRHDAVSRFEPGHGFANRRDLARELMARRRRL